MLFIISNVHIIIKLNNSVVQGYESHEWSGQCMNPRVAKRRVDLCCPDHEWGS